MIRFSSTNAAAVSAIARSVASWTRRFTAGTSGTLTDALPAWWGMWRFGRYFSELIANRRGSAEEDVLEVGGEHGATPAVGQGGASAVVDDVLVIGVKV